MSGGKINFTTLHLSMLNVLVSVRTLPPAPATRTATASATAADEAAVATAVTVAVETTGVGWSEIPSFAPASCSFLSPIDQTSFTWKGNVVLFGLTKLYTKDYICLYTQLAVLIIAR